MTESEQLVTVADAARTLGYTERHIRQLIAEDKLAGTKHGRAWKVTRTSIEQFGTETTDLDADIPADSQLDDRIDAVLGDSINPRVLLAQLEAVERENQLLREQLRDKKAQIASQAAAIVNLVERYAQTD